MNIVCGNDIIELHRNDAPWLNTSSLGRIYHPSELATSTDQQRAGTFAVKEATIKALGLKAGSWLDIEIVRQKSGKPTVRVINKQNIVSIDCTISHDGEYLIATVVALLK